MSCLLSVRVHESSVHQASATDARPGHAGPVLTPVSMPVDGEPVVGGGPLPSLPGPAVVGVTPDVDPSVVDGGAPDEPAAPVSPDTVGGSPKQPHRAPQASSGNSLGTLR
jgi:hypothetical protein